MRRARVRQPLAGAFRRSARPALKHAAPSVRAYKNRGAVTPALPENSEFAIEVRTAILLAAIEQADRERLRWVTGQPGFNHARALNEIAEYLIKARPARGGSIWGENVPPMTGVEGV